MKKLILLFLTLLLGVTASWATTYTITYGSTTGSFYNASNAVVNSGWVSKWVSNEAGKPAVTLTVSANNVNAENGRFAPGQSTSSTYTLSVDESSYRITGFSLNCPTSGAQVTVTPNGEDAVVAATGEKIVVNSSASSFVYSGSNSGRILAGPNDGGSFTITVEDIPAETLAAYNTAKGWITTIQSSNGLVKDAAKYTSNAKSTAEGSYEALLDGDYATYFHTAYGNAGPNADHYLQAELTEAVDAIHFYYKKRSQNNANRPTSITISGSNDGTSFTDITTINTGLPTATATIEYVSDKISLGATYKYLRFTVTATNNGATSNGHVFFTFSEFYVTPADAAIDAAISFYKTMPSSAARLADDQVTQINSINTELTSTIVNVTYKLYESDGTTLVNSVTVEQNKNSAVSVPTALTSAYSPLCYDFATSGTIGSTDCIITVTATPKTGLVTALSELSNSKAYTLSTARGDLYIKTDHLASNSNANVGATAGNFAVISFEGNYYLYSTDASKFVQKDGSLSENVTSNVVAVSLTAQSTKNLFLMKIGSNGVNITDTDDDYELVINTWVTADAGNQYAIIEATDFDATAALAALDDFFNGSTAFNNAIAQLEAYPYGTGVNQYSLVVESIDYTTQASTIISGLKAQGYSADNLATAQALIAGTTLNTNVPVGFYRIQGQTSSKYLAAGLATNNKFNMTTATDATTIFYFDGSKLVNFGSGMANGMNKDAWAWVVGSNASDVTFHDGKTNGGYGIKSATAFFYDNGDNTSSADRGTGADMSTGNIRYRNWYLTEVTTLPVTISAALYATLYAPVALTIPSGVKAYVAADNGEYLTLTEVETTIPANTGVILEGSEGTYDFDITTGVPAVSNALTGTVAAIARPADSYILSNGTSGVGFYKDGATTIPGFKAYLASGVGDVKEFRFDNETGIRSIDNEKMRNGENEMIFNLAGQRVAKAQKGLYIVNGKKLLVK